MLIVECNTCKFYHNRSEYRGVVSGQCRFNPPTWPMVKKTDWCGKHVVKVVFLPVVKTV